MIDSYEYIMILIKRGNMLTSLIRSGPCVNFMNRLMLYKQNISINTAQGKREPLARAHIEKQ